MPVFQTQRARYMQLMNLSTENLESPRDPNPKNEKTNCFLPTPVVVQFPPCKSPSPSSTPPAMSTRSGGPRTAEGKAVTRYNAASHGIYSVAPVLPRIERQACAEPGRSADWLDYRARVFADLAPVGNRAENIHAVCIKISPKLPNEFNVSSNGITSAIR